MSRNKVSSENTTFSYLRGSADFLNLVLNNISSCVLLLDREMRLQAFNNALKTLFSSRKDEHLLFQRCGEALGCAATVEEMKECGKTSQCCTCELRKCGIMTYAEGVEFHKVRITKDFFRNDNTKSTRHLQFSTRSITFNQDRYVIVIVEDITALIQQRETIYQQQKLIDRMKEEMASFVHHE
jgi:nitrogen fixation/metabolism regulation signal transduction histidine kinase